MVCNWGDQPAEAGMQRGNGMEPMPRKTSSYSDHECDSQLEKKGRQGCIEKSATGESTTSYGRHAAVGNANTRTGCIKKSATGE